MDSGKEAVKMFQKLVKKRMVDLDLNQEKLAAMIGRSRQTLSASLKNDNLKEKEMQKIADAMNCDLIIDLRPRDEK
jgi:DNA-binding XRE family transcriptional regulator